MNLDTAYKVKELITDECTRFDLSEICRCYGVTIDDFNDYLDSAIENIEMRT